MSLFVKLNKLPDELINLVVEFMPILTTLFLCKTNYIIYHHLIRQYIPKYKIEEYIRFMVRHDNDFVFYYLLVENEKKWIQMRDYYHRSCIYANYLYFLRSYALDNGSEKCYKILIEKFEELGLIKNQHKKNLIRYL